MKKTTNIIGTGGSRVNRVSQSLEGENQLFKHKVIPTIAFSLQNGERVKSFMSSLI